MTTIASTEFPVLMMPVKLETRFVETIYQDQVAKSKIELWVRIFPDEVFLNSFDKKFTQEEINDRSTYTSASQSAIEFATQDAWKSLVDKYGIYRASWIIHAPDKYWNSKKNDFNGVQSEEEELNFYYQWLPDYFHLYLYPEGGGDPKLKIIERLIEREGLGVFVDINGKPEQDSWINNFDKAFEAGMATRITLKANESKFTKIIAIGLRKEEVAPSAEIVKELLNSHQYSQGFSFIN